MVSRSPNKAHIYSGYVQISRNLSGFLSLPSSMGEKNVKATVKINLQTLLLLAQRWDAYSHKVKGTRRHQ
jgi:hypothetical protein